MTVSTYLRYKPGGCEWSHRVPEHWMISQLKRAIKFQRGHDLPNEMREAGDVPVISSAGVFATHSVSAAKAPGIVTGRYGSIGEFHLIQQDYWPLNTTLYSIDLRGNEPRFLRYMLTHLAPLFLLNSAKAAVPGIDRNDVHTILTAIPTLPEQQTIADFLDCETGKIDLLLDRQQKTLERLSETVTSLVLSSIGEPETRELRLENVALGIKRPVLQREGESYSPIGLFNRGRGLFHKVPREVDEMGDSEFFWIEEGDLIISGQFAWEGAAALAGPGETGCVVSHRYHVLRGKPGIALTEYLFALLLTDRGEFLLNENSRGAAGRNRPLNIRSLLKEKVPIPGISTQEKIAQAVYWRRDLISKISKQYELLKEQRSALISSVVTGQIDVRSYGPQEAAAVCQ